MTIRYAKDEWWQCACLAKQHCAQVLPLMKLLHPVPKIALDPVQLCHQPDANIMFLQFDQVLRAAIRSLPLI